MLDSVVNLYYPSVKEIPRDAPILKLWLITEGNDYSHFIATNL